MKQFDHLPELSGTPQEQAWLRERLETLSVREGYALAAALEHCLPETVRDAVRCLQSLDEYEVVFPGGTYEQLGESYFFNGTNLPSDALSYVDLDALGRQYEAGHPGLFMEGCYVAYPDTDVPRHEKALPLEDKGWSVKIKLASPAVPEGVWVRLPCPDGTAPLDSVELLLALEELNAPFLDACTILDARCVLPRAGCLMEQYSIPTKLVMEGNLLGRILNRHGAEAPDWMETLSAALEYEDCHTMRFALDIAQNLRCYTWVPRRELADSAVKRLSDFGVSDKLIHSGIIDLERYAGGMLWDDGYTPASDHTGYLLRNDREFKPEFTLRMEEPLQQDIIRGIPQLEWLFRYAGREEAAASKTAISEALAERGEEGLRQLQAAMELEKCASLKETVEIAARLDSYEFMETGSFQEQVEQELLEKVVDRELIDRCVDFTAYAALTCGFENIYRSDSAGLYVHRNEAMSRPEQGMTMQ